MAQIANLCRRRKVRKYSLGVAIVFLGFCVGLLLVSDSRVTRSFVIRTESVRERNVPVADVTRSNTVKTPSVAINKNKPSFLLILAYQRTGSSFLGSVFNANPDVFFMYEPLDALYSHMYGTSQGWNVPSDIFNYKNGNLRDIPEAEIKLTTQYINSMLTCDVPSVPMSYLTHRYLRSMGGEFQSLKNFSTCSNKYMSTTKTVQPCLSMPPTHCGHRFGQVSQEKQLACLQTLTNHFYNNDDSIVLDPSLETENISIETSTLESIETSTLASRSPSNTTKKMGKAAEPKKPFSKTMQEYFQCYKKIKSDFPKSCLDTFKRTCTGRNFRVLKTVRASMHTAKQLLELIPENFGVVHILRDPRSVALSRTRFDSSGIGRYAMDGSEPVLSGEAKLYCNAVTRDVQMRRELEQLYPGRIYELWHDDLVADLGGQIKRLHEFIGLPFSKAVKDWLSTRGKRNYNLNKWKQSLTIQQNENILQNCQEFFNITGRALT